MPQNGPTFTERAGHRPGINLEERTAENNAAFLLPHLKPGMTLLDLGCGPGYITIGLAAAVSPGEVVGVDLSEEEVAKSQALATERGVSNVRFEVGDARDLPFAADTFDAIFSNSVLMHMSDPLHVARQVLRVLKPGGVYGASDRMQVSVWGGRPPILDRFHEIADAWQEHRGVDSTIGRKLRPLLRKAGFDPVEASARFNVINGTTERTRWVAQAMIKTIRESSMPRFAQEQGLANQADLDEMVAAFETWGEDPDSFSFHACGEALGWKPA